MTYQIYGIEIDRTCDATYNARIKVKGVLETLEELGLKESMLDDLNALETELSTKDMLGWVDRYQGVNDSTCGSRGLIALLADAVIRKEGIEISADGNVIGVELKCPWGYHGKTKELKMEEFISTLNRYYGKLFDGTDIPTVYGYYDINIG